MKIERSDVKMHYEHKTDNEIVWLRFETGEELCAQLERFFEKEHIKNSSRIVGNRIADRIGRRWKTASSLYICRS